MGQAPTGSLWDLDQDRIEEILDHSIDVFLPAEDPITRKMLKGSMGMMSPDGYGRDWKMIKLFKTGITGVFEQGGHTDDFTLYGGSGGSAVGLRLESRGNIKTFPDPLGALEQRTNRLGIPMRSMLGSVAAWMEEMQAEASSAFIGNVIADKMTGFARNMTSQLCNYMYLSQNDHYKLADFGGVLPTLSDFGGTTNNVMTVDLRNSNYACHRFQTGQILNVVSSDGTTVRTWSSTGDDLQLVVTAVDPLTATIQLMSNDGQSFGASFGSISGLTATDILVYANSYGTANTPYSDASLSSSQHFTGIPGLNSWIKTGDSSGSTATSKNTLLGAESDPANRVNVNDWPEYKSMGIDLKNRPLTEHTLRQICRRFHAAKGVWGQTIDTLIASDGVIMAYEAQKIGRELLDRTGRLANMTHEGSTAGFSFTFDGRTISMHTSNWVENGTVYGVKTSGNNWKRVLPPDPKALRGLSMTEPFGQVNPDVAFKFVGPLLGYRSVWVPISVNNPTTNYSQVGTALQAPGMLRMTIIPEQPAGLKIVNVAEDRRYADYI